MQRREFDATITDWVRLTDADGTCDTAERNHANRDAQWVQDLDGGWTLKVRCGSLDGAELSDIHRHLTGAEFEADWATARAKHGPAACAEDLERTDGQRRFDAFAANIRRGANAPPGTSGRSRVVTNVVIDHATFERIVRGLTGAPVDSGDVPLDPDGERSGCCRLRGWQDQPMTNWTAGDFDYDSHGDGYNGIRQPDPRIAAQVTGALGDARTVLNIGAGAGSYEPTDRYVAAVEPSATMRAQRPSRLAPAINAVAESLPFDDAAFDSAMAVLTVHHWPDTEAGLHELRRVTRGPVVVLTFDGPALERFWLNEYAPELIAVERRRYPTIDLICDALGGTCTVDVVTIPFDCTDGFGDAFYGRPEQFLDPAVRKAQSGWGFVDAEAETRAVDRLRADLDSGGWDRRHGHLRTQPTYEGAVRLIAATPNP